MRLANALLACAGSATAILSGTLIFGLNAPAKTASAAEPLVAAPVNTAGFGTIKGRLVYKGEVPKAPALKVEKVQFCDTIALVDRSLEVDPKTKGVANGLVWINAPKGKNPEAEKALVAKTPVVKIDNKNCEFSPRSSALFKGQGLEFTSSDPVGHNSHVTGFSYACNLALAPKGKADAPKVQAEKRPMNLKCDIHGWMQGWVLVCDHPFFAVTDTDGSFVITGVPAGTQNLIVWQEKAGYVTPGAAKGQAVEVKAGDTVDLGDVVLDSSKVKK